MSDVVVETRSGRLRGVTDRGVHIFKGIPYAAPPLVERRFRPPETAELTGDDPGRLALGDRTSRAGLAFARHGTPGHAGLPDWPAYSAAARDTMIFDTECRMECDPHGTERQIWGKPHKS